MFAEANLRCTSHAAQEVREAAKCHAVLHPRTRNPALRSSTLPAAAAHPRQWRRVAACLLHVSFARSSTSARAIAAREPCTPKCGVPTILTSWTTDVNLTKALVKAGGRVKGSAHDGTTPLHEACAHGCVCVCFCAFSSFPFGVCMSASPCSTFSL